MEFYADGNAILWTRRGEQLRVEPWGRDGIRVRATVDCKIHDDLPGALLHQEAPPDAETQVSEDGGSIRNGNITVRLDAQKARLVFTRASDQALLLEEVDWNAEHPYLYPAAREFSDPAGGYSRLQANFKARDDERFYGLGQHRHPLLDQKGAVIDLVQRNAEVCIPFLVSSCGYGFLWNNPAMGRVELGQTQTRWIAEETKQLDYFVTAGDSYAENMETYADATGHSPMLPEFAAGFWQSKLRYVTQDELMTVARRYHREGLPLSVIVCDFYHWPAHGDWDWDYEKWPDPDGMIRELKEMGIELMVSVWPTVEIASRNFHEMQENGYLVRTRQGTELVATAPDPQPTKRVGLALCDPFNEKARDFLWEQVRKNYYDKGCRVFWLDACEPEIGPPDTANMRFAEGPAGALTNMYPFYHEKGFHDHLTAAGESEVITLCRSAWAGSQRFGAAVWNGDIPSTWEALGDSLRAGLNIMMSGIPWWTTDIGGFSGGDPKDPEYAELLVRWFQYGVFCPLFRLHGVRVPMRSDVHSGADNEIWSYGEETFAILKDILFLRERLRPYVMEQMKRASKRGTPPMRPVFFDFQQDAVACDIDDQFLFGPDLLVCPVLEKGARQRRVYLPESARWTHAWTGETVDGGQWLTVDAPLDQIPVFLKNDAAIPIRGESGRQL
ncbi:MAG: TIM-barrel domain-containing protein [Verrucomicrobiota bacterium]